MKCEFNLYFCSVLQALAQQAQKLTGLLRILQKSLGTFHPFTGFPGSLRALRALPMVLFYSKNGPPRVRVTVYHRIFFTCGRKSRKNHSAFQHFSHSSRRLLQVQGRAERFMPVCLLRERELKMQMPALRGTLCFHNHGLSFPHTEAGIKNTSGICLLRNRFQEESA